MVIQRWQSLFLLIACAVMACFTFCSLGQFQTADYTFNFTSLGIFSEGVPTGGAKPDDIYTVFFFAISLTSALIPLVDIFLFNKGKLQITLCYVEILFLCATMACGAVIGYTTFEGVAPGWSTVVICPVLAVILTIMAINRISHDLKLLRSADRIR